MTSDQYNALTFDWYDRVVPKNVEISQDDKHLHLVEYTNDYKQTKSKLVLEATNFTSEFSDSISWTKSTGFVDTVFFSYREHHNIIIRPDDIWTAIVIQFSLYVNANAEELRYFFVNFHEKEKLKVEFVAPVDRIPIDEFITKIVDLIAKNVDAGIIQWISPNFTTTTRNDKLAAGVALMATVKSYFDYSMWSVLCGIPRITILGSVDDWKEIRERVEILKEYELNGKDVMAKWSHMLGRILNEFVSVKEGNSPDKEFWNQAIRVDYEMVDMICAQSEETFLNGWITAFTAFDKGGNWQGGLYSYDNWLRISTDRITPGTVSVPIQIHDEYAMPDERNYNGSIITGHMGYSVKKDRVTIQPMSGWAMVIGKNIPKYLKREK